MEISQSLALEVMEQLRVKKIVGSNVGERGHRIYQNAHTRVETRVAQNVLKGLKIKDDNEEMTQNEIDEQQQRKKVRSYRLTNIRDERNDPPFLQKPPSPRRVLQRKPLIPRNTNMKRNRVHGADWLETARKERGISNDVFQSSCDEDEKMEKELLGEFSQDSIFKQLVNNRKSSASSKPIHQYGRKKRRRGL